MDAVAGLLGSDEFLRGVALGAAALLVGLLFRRLQPDWGFLWGGAVIAGFLLSERFSSVQVTRALEGRLWVAVASGLAGVVAAAALYRQRRSTHLPLAVGISVAGMWLTLPDTAQIALLVGVTLVSTWLWWPTPIVSLGLLGALLIPAASAWATVVGSVGRDTAAIGALGSLVMLVAFDWQPSGRTWLQLTFHGALVVVWSRVAGLASSLETGMVIGVALTAMILVAKRLVALRENSAADVLSPIES